MLTSKNLFIFMVLINCLYSCKSNNDNDTEKESFNPVQSGHAVSKWLDRFDIDGDRINDHIDFDFTGGAHCCYKIHIVLSSDKIERRFPFEMDGGYIGKVDNSQPDQFDINDMDTDGLPEILMRIQTYNNETEPIPLTWQNKYGFKSNRIVIDYHNGQLKIKDYSR